MIALDKLRYLFTEHVEKFVFTIDNYKLLIHPSVKNNKNNDLLNRVYDDINLMPDIDNTIDNIGVKFYTLGYKEEMYYKSELLAFIFASINSDWSIIKGIDINYLRTHFWLKNGNVIYDPSLSIITSEEIYSKTFKRLKEINSESIEEYLSQNNNLWRFYHKRHDSKDPMFSLNFIKDIIDKFNKNVNDQYILNDESISEIKDWICHDNFIRLRQVLTQKRVSSLEGDNISLHPSVDERILERIKKVSGELKNLMRNEYNIKIDYYSGTLGNCYALSILLNLYDSNFKLIQGYIPYKSAYFLENSNCRYQHSWLEVDNYVYDPALKIITPKELYYMFVNKEDEYTQEDTENMLRRIGFNLTHFRDFMSKKQIGGDETIRYRMLVDKIDSKEFKEEAEELITHVKKLIR